MRSFKFTAAILFMLETNNLIFAQGVCIPSNLIVSGIQGRVGTAQNNDPFPDISVSLINEAEDDEEKRLFASTKTAGDGSFEFSNIKPGNYLILAEPPGFPPYSVRIKLKRGKPKVDLQEIFIAFGDDEKKICRGNFSQLRRKS